MSGSWRSGDRLRVGSGLSWSGLVVGVDSSSGLRLGSSGVRHTLHGTERAATWHLTDGGLSPALALDGNRGSRAEVLIELVGSLAVVAHRRGGRRWDAALTPRLGSVLVLS